MSVAAAIGAHLAAGGIVIHATTDPTLEFDDVIYVYDDADAFDVLDEFETEAPVLIVIDDPDAFPLLTHAALDEPHVSVVVAGERR